MCRELTRDERRTIRKLVTGECANYDSEYGCLPLECPCYMLDKCWTGALCRYFREVVLPLDPMLESSIVGEGAAPDTRPCAICGRPFIPEGRRAIAPKPARPRATAERAGNGYGKCGRKPGPAVTIRP